jgi:virginiamycin B lyase
MQQCAPARAAGVAHYNVWQEAIAMRSLVIASLASLVAGAAHAAPAPVYFDVVAGSAPHDVAAAPGPGAPVYYTGQRNGTLGILDPATGKVEEVALGPRSAPHGVIVGPDGAAWITDGGQNAIVRVDPATRAVKKWPLPEGSGYANLNTLTFDRKGRVWFTGQSGIYGTVDPARNDVKVWQAPRGRGPYGITTTPSGDVYYASLAGNHIARIDVDTGQASVIEPPTKDQGARRVWSDSRGRIWVSYWNTGQVGMYDPAPRAWTEWKLPGNAHAYSVWVDAADKVWLTDWSTNALVRFDPATEKFESYPSTKPQANVRQMLGRKGEAWGAESGLDRLVMVPAP